MLNPTHRTHLTIESIGVHLGLMVCWAVMLFLSFPEPGWGGLAHIALVPAVLLAVGSTSTWRVAWTSYIVALAWWLIRLSWMIPVTVGGHVVLSMYLALYLPLALVAVRIGDHRWRVTMTFWLPVVWVSLELVRAFFPAGGFSWLSLGHSQGPYASSHGASRLIQIADLFGEHGVSFLVAMTNGLIVDWMLGARRTPKISGPKSQRWVVLPAVVWLTVFMGAWWYGGHRIRELDTLGPVKSLRVAVVQTNVPQNNKDNPTAKQMLNDWQRLLDLTHQAADSQPAPRLVAWPETMVPAGLNAAALAHDRKAGFGRDLFHEQIQDLARQRGVYLLVGAHAYDHWQTVVSPDGQHRFELPATRHNAAYLYQPNGDQSPHRYDKIHRVPFGEYIPWVEHVPWLKRQFIKYLSPYNVDYTLQAGRTRTVFQLSAARGGTANTLGLNPGPRLSTPICFEDAVARVTRSMVFDANGAKRSDLLVNLTNDGWYAGTHQGPQHLQIAVFRCVENRVPMARSVNTGISGFIDSVGRVGPLVRVAGQSQQVEGFAAHTVVLDPRQTVFGRWGHLSSVALVAAAAVATAASARRRRRQTDDGLDP